MIVNQGSGLVAYFVELATAAGDGKTASNWVQQDVMRTLKERHLEIDTFPLRPAALAELLKVVKEGQLDTSRAREIFIEMLDTGHSAAELMKAKGIAKVDESELVALAKELLAANPKILADIKSGKVQAASNLIGQAKKKNPNVNPGRFREIVIELAGTM